MTKWRLYFDRRVLSGWKRWLFVIVAAFAFYLATVGLVSAASRHVEDGRLQWLGPKGLSVLAAYEWPAQCLSMVAPVTRPLFEWSADFWCAITRAPETT